MKLRAGCLAVTVGALLAFPAAASAATITVTSTADSGAGTLRAALAAANDDDTIVVPAGTYGVTSGELLVADSVTIRGAGARRTILQSNGNGRVIAIANGQDPVSISGLTITRGNAGHANGGGIFTESALTLTGVALTANRADPTPSPRGDGGGVAANGAHLTVRASLIAGNRAYNGAGIYTLGAATVENTTITGNTSGTPGDNGWAGGALLGTGSLLLNTTIAGNRDFGADPGDLEDSAGGIYVDSFTARNTIIAGNLSFAPNGQPAGSPGNPAVANNCSNSKVATVTNNNSIESGSDCLFTDASSRRNTDPRLRPLRNNGGQTDTLALRARSKAIDRGAGCLVTDQRGLSRALGGRCDIGAYEQVACGGVAVNLFGTAGNDKLIGTARPDGILGLAGRDVLKGKGGRDGLCGGKGRDRLLGGKGRDKLLGGRGRDRLRGGPGRDRLRGGPGRDIQRQ